MTSVHKKESQEDLMRAPLIALLLLTVSLLLPTQAFADLYKYETEDGEIMISTSPRSGMKLIEVISMGGSGSSSAAQKSSGPVSAKKAQKKARNMARAQTAKLQHIARHGRKHSTEDMRRAEREQTFDDIIEEASATYDVPVAFIKGVIRVESNFNPHAVSHAGAQGLMQLMPGTAAGLNVRDPFEPRQNIFGGTKLLRTLIDQYDGDINLILSAYNAGGVAVRRYDGIPYPQTRDYVASVYRWYKFYSVQENQSP